MPGGFLFHFLSSQPLPPSLSACVFPPRGKSSCALSAWKQGRAEPKGQKSAKCHPSNMAVRNPRAPRSPSHPQIRCCTLSSCLCNSFVILIQIKAFQWALMSSPHISSFSFKWQARLIIQSYVPPHLLWVQLNRNSAVHYLAHTAAALNKSRKGRRNFIWFIFVFFFFLRQKIRWAEVGVKLTLGKGIGAFGFSGLLLRDFRMIAWYQRALENIISADVISAEKQNHIARVTPGEKGPKQTSITTK